MTFPQALLYAHIFTGSIALITGYLAIIVRRGGINHRRLGRIYVKAMWAVVVTAFVMATLSTNFFLFGLAILTTYLIYTGHSATGRPRDDQHQRDKLAAYVFSSIAVIALVSGAIAFFVAQTIVQFEFILIAFFSLVGLFVGGSDIKLLNKGPIIGRERIVRHLGSMCGGLIATTTAVAVTLNGIFGVLPALIGWIAPSVVIVPVIVYWTRQVRGGTFKP